MIHRTTIIYWLIQTGLLNHLMYYWLLFRDQWINAKEILIRVTHRCMNNVKMYTCMHVWEFLCIMKKRFRNFCKSKVWLSVLLVKIQKEKRLILNVFHRHVISLNESAELEFRTLWCITSVILTICVRANYIILISVIFSISDDKIQLLI